MLVKTPGLLSYAYPGGIRSLAEIFMNTLLMLKVNDMDSSTGTATFHFWKCHHVCCAKNKHVLLRGNKKEDVPSLDSKG